MATRGTSASAAVLSANRMERRRRVASSGSIEPSSAEVSIRSSSSSRVRDAWICPFGSTPRNRTIALAVRLSRSTRRRVATP